MSTSGGIEKVLNARPWRYATVVDTHHFSRRGIINILQIYFKVNNILWDIWIYYGDEDVEKNYLKRNLWEDQKK